MANRPTSKFNFASYDRQFLNNAIFAGTATALSLMTIGAPLLPALLITVALVSIPSTVPYCLARLGIAFLEAGKPKGRYEKAKQVAAIVTPYLFAVPMINMLQSAPK